MAIDPDCFKCGEELDERGAILISPPCQGVKSNDTFDKVEKYHLCSNCFERVMRYIERAVK